VNKETTVLNEFLEAYRKPAFGALPKAQIDAFVVRILRERNEIKGDDIWNLIEDLKISSGRARSIVYNMSLQKMQDAKEIDREIINFLKAPNYESKDKEFYLDVENPLIIDRIKCVLRENKAIADGSFSPNIIRLSHKAFLVLVRKYDDKKELEALEKELSKEFKGKVIDINTQDVLLDVMKLIAGIVANRAGEKFVDYIELFWSNRKEFISKCKTCFAEVKDLPLFNHRRKK